MEQTSSHFKLGFEIVTFTHVVRGTPEVSIGNKIFAYLARHLFHRLIQNLLLTPWMLRILIFIFSQHILYILSIILHILLFLYIYIYILNFFVYSVYMLYFLVYSVYFLYSLVDSVKILYILVYSVNILYILHQASTNSPPFT